MREERREGKGIALCPSGEGPFSSLPPSQRTTQTSETESGIRSATGATSEKRRGCVAGRGIAKFLRKVGIPEILDISYIPIKWTAINHLNFLLRLHHLLMRQSFLMIFDCMFETLYTMLLGPPIPQGERGMRIEWKTGRRRDRKAT